MLAQSNAKMMIPMPNERPKFVGEYIYKMKLNPPELQVRDNFISKDMWGQLYGLADVQMNWGGNAEYAKPIMRSVLGTINQALRSGARFDEPELADFARNADMLLVDFLKNKNGSGIKLDNEMKRLVGEARRLGLLTDLRMDSGGFWGC